ncbi:MAG: hypothetical protein AAF799_12840 [Myxococcota bacterium]
MNVQDLSWFQRMALRMMGSFERRTYGYQTPFVAELVRTHGMGGMFGIGRAITKVVNDLDKAFGTEPANLLLGILGLWNGCSWCSVGHIRAANLLRFARTGEPYAIDERKVPEWKTMDFDALEDHLVELVGRDSDEARLIRAAAAIQDDRETDFPERELVQRAVHAWALVNDCSITLTYDLDPAVVPALLPKDAADQDARDRYLALRPLDEVIGD